MTKFLIADDSIDKIRLLEAFLKRAGWTEEVLIAMTTEEALEHIGEHAISHAFVDYYIPSMNGPSVIAQLRKQHPASRVALVSSADNPRNRDEALEAGAEAFVCTSWPMDEVERQMLSLLGEWAIS